MMKNNVATAEISRPYAEALMSLAQSKNVEDKFDSDVRSLLNLLKESEPLQNFFANPFINGEDKMDSTSLPGKITDFEESLKGASLNGMKVGIPKEYF
ncbi:MAG: F0F1 ATP synthase subunit delta, partial [Rivularia sp. ALOHA_DT_140]|nr:F0F1 ATP synthase subunit delta [Rivularia sp. ALOHA_DT_140]